MGSVTKNREAFEIRPGFLTLRLSAVEDEASVRVDGGLRAAQEDPRRREGLRPQGGGGQSQQPESPLRARPHRGGRLQEHHGKALQQEDGEEGEWRREGGELRLMRRLKEVLRKMWRLRWVGVRQLPDLLPGVRRRGPGLRELLHRRSLPQLQLDAVKN